MTITSCNAPESDIPSAPRPSLTTPIHESILLLLGSYLVALVLTTAIHEIGHGLALSSISIGFRLVLNPFSLSMAQPLSPVPMDSLLFVVTSGTAMELLFGFVVFLLLWRFRNPFLVPLLMCAPAAFLSSGGYFLAGVSVVDGDTAMMLSLGVPSLLIQGLGVVLIVVGAVVLILLFPLFGIAPNDSFRKLFLILFIGMTLHGFGMITFASVFNPSELSIGLANVVSMSISVLIFAGVYTRSSSFFDRLAHTEVAELDRIAIYSAIGFALLLIVLEILFLN